MTRLAYLPATFLLPLKMPPPARSAPVHRLVGHPLRLVEAKLKITAFNTVIGARCVSVLRCLVDSRLRWPTTAGVQEKTREKPACI